MIYHLIEIEMESTIPDINHGLPAERRTKCHTAGLQGGRIKTRTLALPYPSASKWQGGSENEQRNVSGNAPKWPLGERHESHSGLN